MLPYFSKITPEYVSPVSLPPNCELPIILIGLGGIGNDAVARAYQKLKSIYPHPIRAYAVDTDPYDFPSLKTHGVNCIPIQSRSGIEHLLSHLSSDEILHDLFGDSALMNAYDTEPAMRRSLYSRTASFIALREAFAKHTFKLFENELIDFLQHNPNTLLYLVTESSGDFGSGALLPLAARIERLCSDHNLQTSINAIITSPELAMSDLHHGVPHSAANSYAMLKELLILQNPTLTLTNNQIRYLGFLENDCKKRLFSSIRIVEQPAQELRINAYTELLKNVITATLFSKKVFHPHAALSRVSVRSILLDKQTLAKNLVDQHMQAFLTLPFCRALFEITKEKRPSDIVKNAIGLVNDIQSGKREDDTDGILTRLALDNAGLPIAVRELLSMLEEGFVQDPSDCGVMPDFDSIVQPFSKPRGLLTRKTDKRVLQCELQMATDELRHTSDRYECFLKFEYPFFHTASRFAEQLFTPAYHEKLGIKKENGQYEHPLYTLLSLCFLYQALQTALQKLQDESTAKKKLLIVGDVETENASPELLKAMKKSELYRYGEYRLLYVDQEYCESSRHPYEDLLILQKDIETVKRAAQARLFDHKREQLYKVVLSLLDQTLEAYVKSLDNMLRYTHQTDMTDSYAHTYSIDLSRYCSKTLLNEKDLADIQAIIENGIGRAIYENDFSSLSEACDKIVAEVYSEKLALLSILDEFKKEHGTSYDDALKGALATCRNLPIEFQPTTLLLPQKEWDTLEAWWRESETEGPFDLSRYVNPHAVLEKFICDKLGMSLTVKFIDSTDLDNDRIFLLYETPYVKPETYDPLVNKNPAMASAYHTYQHAQAACHEGYSNRNPHVFYTFNTITLPFEETN